jgi:hypothetical protein
MKEIQEIAEKDLPDVDKLAQAFNLFTSRYVEHAQNEIELRRAMGDEESVIKERIKSGVMETARGIFQDCYRVIMGRSAWDE